jgi:lysophospholipase L1-like esterase
MRSLWDSSKDDVMRGDIFRNTLHYQMALFAFFLFSAIAPVAAEVFFAGDNPNIRYYGRFDMSNPADPVFNWSGTTIQAAFTGALIGIELRDGACDYDVDIDGTPYPVVKTQAGVTRYYIATNLPGGTHVIQIVQRNENHWGRAVFYGFYCADGGQLLALPPRPLRKIEFVGDSHLAGYGVESPSRSCDSVQYRTYTNANESYGRLISRTFGAQDMLLSWSGAGMVRNYNDPLKKSLQPFPYHYPQLLGDVGGVWNFTQWTPDVVVITLGANDFSTTPAPDDSMYVNGYHNFIATVLGHYPNACLVCVTQHVGAQDRCVQQVVAAETTSLGHKKVFFAAYPQLLTLTGCDWHPSVSDQALIANSILAKIMAVTGWDTTGISVAYSPGGRRQALRLQIAGMRSGCIVFRTSQSQPQAKLEILDLEGRIVEQGRINGAGEFSWNTLKISDGIYLAGNAVLGWSRVVVRQGR